MRKALKQTVIPALLTAVMLLSGCSGSQPTAKPAQTEPPTQTETAAPAASGSKVLVFGRGGDSVNLDPITTSDGESAFANRNMFETLVNYEETSTKVVPGLAESWDISPDGLTYTFKLRQGVKFHDGTDFNADAVVFNLNRWMDKSNPLHIPDAFTFYFDMFGGYKGDEGHLIDSVTAPDATTVVFKLRKPSAPFLQNLGMHCFGIASPAALEKYKDKFGENPVGTGPFKFVEWKRNDSITMVKNEQYWKQGYPKLDKVILKVIPENTARLTALTAGEIDMMAGVNPEDVQTVKENPELQLFLRPGMNLGFLGFNVQKKPFDNQKVREALSYAVNKAAIIEAFFGGLAVPAKNPLPPTIWGHNDEVKAHEFNLDKARQLLAEAGYPNGFKAKLWSMPVFRDYMPDSQKIAEVIQQDFKKIGVDIEIVTYEWATYLAKTSQGEQEMFLLGWIGDNGDPDNFLYSMLDKNNIGGNNRNQYGNEGVHKLLVQAQTERSQEKRAELYKKAQVIIAQDVPMVPLVHSQSAIAAKAQIVDYVPHPTGAESFEKIDFKE